MIYQKRTLFRQESLDRLASTEKLDQLMKVVGSKRMFEKSGKV
jgi:HlyD family secretion protein